MKSASGHRQGPKACAIYIASVVRNIDSVYYYDKQHERSTNILSYSPCNGRQDVIQTNDIVF